MLKPTIKLILNSNPKTNPNNKPKPNPNSDLNSNPNFKPTPNLNPNHNPNPKHNPACNLKPNLNHTLSPKLTLTCTLNLTPNKQTSDVEARSLPGILLLL